MMLFCENAYFLDTPSHSCSCFHCHTVCVMPVLWTLFVSVSVCLSPSLSLSLSIYRYLYLYLHLSITYIYRICFSQVRFHYFPVKIRTARNLYAAWLCICMYVLAMSVTCMHATLFGACLGGFLSLCFT